MAWTSHGWHIHGTNLNDPFPTIIRKRCENPSRCLKCVAETEAYLKDGILPTI